MKVDRTTSSECKVNIMRLQFLNTIKHDEIPKLRGAILSKIESPDILFHNHKGDGLRYKYPLIQYKVIDGKAVVLCVNEGVSQIHNFLTQEAWQMKLGSKSVQFELDEIYNSSEDLKQTKELCKYKITNWLPLNSEKIKKYNSLNELDRNDMLKAILIGNILSFSKGVDFWMKEKIELPDLVISKSYKSNFKGNQFLSFDVYFKVNLMLPNAIGLGKGASVGNGVISKLN
jgi:hypothetical protein